jgi:hypothetical protein
MKLRYGFVSNSSTTSFTCEICGRTESYYDSASHTDFGFVICENEHNICEEEVIGEIDLTDEQLEELEQNGYDIPSANCPICQFQVISNPNIKRYLKKEKCVDESEAFEEIKKINKRRKVLRDNEYVQFVCRKFNLTEESLLKETKEKFGTYEKFIKYINKK